MRSRQVYLVVCLAVLLVAFYLRAADLQHIPPGLHFDDARKIQRAWRISQGYGLPIGFQEIPEPFDVILRAGFMSLAGGIHPFLAQMVSVWLGTLTTAATMAAASRLYRGHARRNTVVLTAGLALAVMPPSVVIGHHIYRANWIPPMTMLALAALVWSWRTNRLRAFAAAGVFTALATLFYLGGIFFPPTAALLLLFASALVRFRWPSRRALLIMAAAFGLVMLPWLYFYLRTPNWFERANALASGNSPLRSPAALLQNIGVTIATLFVPDSLHIPRYNTFTTAFLNPALVVLFVLGLAATLRRWRIPWLLSPLLIIAVMAWPNILSNEPYQPVRLVGVYAPLALVVGLGAGEALVFAARTRLLYRATVVVLALVFIGSPIYTAYHVWYHYYAQPLLSNPNIPESLAYVYRIGYSDLLQQVIDSDQPVYLPVEYFNSDLAVARLRPVAFPRVRPYDGRPLPGGRIVLPVNSIIYGLFELDHVPVQYGLALPDSGEILILPPLPLDTATELEERIRARGDDVKNDRSWLLGRSETVRAGDSPFEQVRWLPGDILGSFDGNLELVGVDAPSDLRPGAQVPVTLYWRLRQTTGHDYFSRLQTWDYAGNSQGAETGSTIVNENGAILSIFTYLYPTVMWQPGEIVPETRWLPVYENAPPGGYRFAVSAYTYPGPTAVLPTPEPDRAASLDHWLLAGRSAVSLESFTASAGETVTPVNADLGGTIRLNSANLNPPLTALKPGGRLDVRLNWQAVAPIGESYTLFLHLTDTDGKLVAQQDVLPFDGQFPTWAWPPDMTVPTAHTLTIAPDARPPFTLTLGMYRYPSFDRLPVVQNGVESPDRLVVVKSVE